MIVTFCGHRDIRDYDRLQIWLTQCIEQLILEGATEFYLGGYGSFDSMAKAVVWELKKNYPMIRSILILPYLDKRQETSQYDESIYPPLETVPKRYCILRRNEWMVQKADIVVAYVYHNWGGAATMLEYARRKKKRIIQYDQ